MKIDKKQSEEKSEEKPVEKWFYNESRVFTEYHEDKKGMICESQDKRIYLNCKIIRTPKKKTLLDGNCKIDNVDFTIMQYIQLEKESLPDDPFKLVLKLFGGIKKKLSGVRGQIQERSIPDSSKDELITYFIKAFIKNSEVSKNKKTTSSSVYIGTTSKSTPPPPPPTGTCKVCRRTGQTPGSAITRECAKISANMSQNCSSVSFLERATTVTTTNCTKLTSIFYKKVCGF